jgi:hypothetical protein
MGVIKHKRPCVAPGFGFRQKNRKSFDEVFAILFIIEYSAAPYALIMTWCKRPGVSRRDVLGMSADYNKQTFLSSYLII